MKKNLWLWLIVGVALLLRIWQVGDLPAILNRDEAAVAYNSYLLMETGKDEWGKSWPAVLESFGDHKLPGYSIALIPFFKIFGLHDWVVRLPSVLAGTILVILVYSLSKKIQLSEQASLFTALLTAVSPVFVFYSRMAFEANLALTYFVGALLTIFCLSEKPKTWKYVLLTVLLLLSVFTYNTPLLLLPFVMLAAVFVFEQQNRPSLIITAVILAAIAAIGLYVLLPVAAQKSGITIFTDESVWSQWTAFRSSLSGPWQTIIGSRYVYFLGLMIRNIANSFSLDFLVTRGGSHPWHSLPMAGHLAAITYVLGLIGIFRTVAEVWLSRLKKVQLRPQLTLLLLLAASLLPAVITVDAPHATRSLLFFVMFHIFAGIGTVWIIEHFFKQRKNSAWKVLILLAAAEGALHAYQLFELYPQQQAALQPGFGHAVQDAERDYPSEKIAIVDAAGYHYILLAWYLKLPPEVYFQTIIRQQPDQIGFRYGERLTHYHFIAHPEDRAADESVLIQWSDEKQVWQVGENL